MLSILEIFLTICSIPYFSMMLDNFFNCILNLAPRLFEFPTFLKAYFKTITFKRGADKVHEDTFEPRVHLVERLGSSAVSPKVRSLRLVFNYSF